MACSYDEQMLSAFCFAGILAFALMAILPQLPAHEFVWVGLFLSTLTCLLIATRSSCKALLKQTHRVVGGRLIAQSLHKVWLKQVSRIVDGRCIVGGRFIVSRLGQPYTYGMAIVLGFGLSFSYALDQAHERINQRLTAVHEAKVARVQLRVSSIALYTPEAIRFDAQVLSSTPAGGMPKTIRVRWPLAVPEDIGRSKKDQLKQKVVEINLAESPAKTGSISVSDIEEGENFAGLESSTAARVQPVQRPILVRPGQVWAMSLELKSPRSLINPGGFDYETYAFRENVLALAHVRGTPQLLNAYEAGSWDTWVQAIRHDIREAMHNYLHDKRYGAVLIALVMGDQSSISSEDWELFNRTGMTHLVSISGSHITMLSSIVVLMFMWLWPYCRWRGKSLADRQAGLYWAGALGVIVALAYCLLAGWGVPAQRTFLMLALFYLCNLLRLPMSISSMFVLVALVVLFLDPWSILAPGFYLSFAAVAVLRHLVIQMVLEPSPQVGTTIMAKLIGILYKLKLWGRMQLAITIVLAPFLLIFFNQVSLISPLVNAYAILIVGAIVTPMALLLGVLALFNPYIKLTQWWADTCHQLLDYTMQLTQLLAALPWASLNLPGASGWALALALFGVLCFVLPKGLPLKPLALLFLMPAFIGRQQCIVEGDWQLWAFDVGQASAILVHTSKHSLLFDTGVKTQLEHDSVTRVVIPSFRYLGVGELDTVVVSHTDSDHSGGFASLISEWPVRHAYASFQLDHFLQTEQVQWDREITPVTSELAYQACQSGHTFTWDGVRFRFMFPQAQVELPRQAGNEHSCVLMIEGKQHSALLTGDILRAQEEQFDWPSVDLVVAAHHGSSSSSSTHFVGQTQPQHVIVQAAYGNRYGHPHKAVVRRWLDSGAQLWNTANQGAIQVSSSYKGLVLKALREEQLRYWHAP